MDRKEAMQILTGVLYDGTNEIAALRMQAVHLLASHAKYSIAPEPDKATA